MPPHLGYFILSAGNDIVLRQHVDRDISNDGLLQIAGQVHGDTIYWFVLAGSYQIQRGNGPASNIVITATQTATLG